MRKICILIMLFALFPMLVFANTTKTYGTYDEAIKIVKEVMKSYYIKGERIQYNHSRATYGDKSPEDATSQSTLHTVCSGFSSNVYQEAFGMKNLNYHLKEDGSKVYDYPLYTSEIISKARNYYNTYKSDSEKLNGNFLIYYEKDSTRYIYNTSSNNVSVSEFAQLIQPGDLVVYTGHVLMAYDKFEKENGTWDVLLLNATQGPFILSRIIGTSKMSYAFLARSKNGIIDVDYNNIEGEGTIRYIWLSALTQFVSNGNISCSEEECSVIRMIYKKNNNASYNYNIDTEQYDKSKLRLLYPGLDIDKTVSIWNGNNVNLGDKITYTIKVKNKSNVSTTNGVSDGKKYSKFYVEEIIDLDKVEFVPEESNGQINGNKITWTVNELGIDSSKELKYTVKVKNDLNNVGETIASSGNFFVSSNSSKIALATIENKIVANNSNIFSTGKSYQDCYEEKSQDFTGLELINEVIKCSTNKDFKFNDSNILTNLLYRGPLYYKNKDGEDKVRIRDGSNAIIINSNIKTTESAFLHKKMILNNYWGGTNYYGDNNRIYLGLPRWEGSVASNRAQTINPTDFKEGDILIYQINNNCSSDNIPEYPKNTASSDNPNADVKTCNGVYTGKYTNENGTYAYIYVNGKFKGINGSGDSERNAFIYEYYKNTALSKLYNATSSSNSWNTLWETLDPSVQQSYLEYFNYQTLLEKDYYVILRPELIMKYVTKFNKNGGTGTMNAQSMTYDTSSTLIPNAFTKTGYIFKNWNVSSDGSGTSYSDRSNVKNMVTNDDGIVNLYAQWSPITYSIKFNSNGGTGNMSNKSMTYDTASTLTANSFTRNGYKFAEWNTKADGSGTSYTDKKSVKNLATATGDTINLYAIWEELYSYIVDNEYDFNKTSKIISKIQDKTTVNYFKSKITLNEKYTINIESKENSGIKYVYTGGKAQIYKNGNLYEEITNIVTGDITGDGIVNISDVAKLYRYLRKKITMDDIYIKAGNVVYTDDKITISDVAKLYRYLRKKISNL